MNTSSTWRSRISITAAPKPRARKQMEFASASIAPCWTSSTGSPFVKRFITRSMSCRSISTLGWSNTTIVDRIKAAGASAKPRCRPFLTPSHWRRRNSWPLDHDRQIHRFRQTTSRLSDQVSANTHHLSGSKLEAEKVKVDVGKVAAPVDILAVDDLRLIRMQHQLADRQAVGNCAPECPRLFGALAVTNDIVRIPLEQ